MAFLLTECLVMAQVVGLLDRFLGSHYIVHSIQTEIEHTFTNLKFDS